MQTMGHVELMHGWCAPWNEAAFIAALTEGGDSRLLVDPATGTNRYFIPPAPTAGGVCFSACTASPISEAGYRQAMRCYVDLVTARSRDDAAERRAAWLARVTATLDSYLQLHGLADILLLPSGTDGLLLCSILLSLESNGAPMTAILPAASETGSGVPRAAVRQAFDGPISTGRPFGAVQIPLRTADGRVRDGHAIDEDFALASRICAGRPVVYVTYGSKTGLVAPLAIPPGADVVVDACQLRLSPWVIKACLGKGWPVVVSGSKYVGGPPSSGAVLLPRDRFAGLREKALAEWSHIVGAGQASAGPLLRWVAATTQIEAFSAGDRCVFSQASRIGLAYSALRRVPGVATIDGPSPQMIDAAGSATGIISFSVANPHDPDVLLTSAQLRAVHGAMAGRGVLLGQPVDVGRFGALRLAFGLQDHMTEQLKANLDSVAGVLSEVLAQPDFLTATAPSTRRDGALAPIAYERMTEGGDA
jgi:hypothetical protein